MMSNRDLYMGHAEDALRHMREMEKPNAAEVKFETVCGNPLISDYGEKIDEYIKNAGIDEYAKNHIIYPQVIHKNVAFICIIILYPSRAWF